MSVRECLHTGPHKIDFTSDCGNSVILPSVLLAFCQKRRLQTCATDHELGNLDPVCRSAGACPPLLVVENGYCVEYGYGIECIFLDLDPEFSLRSAQ